MYEKKILDLEYTFATLSILSTINRFQLYLHAEKDHFVFQACVKTVVYC